MTSLRVFAAALVAAAGFATPTLAAPGALDRTFGNQGIATFDFTPEESRNEAGIDMSLQPDGRMVVLSETSNNFGVQYIVSRHDTDGSLDATFGIGGKVTLEGGTCATCFNASRIARRSDGGFIVAGTRHLPGDGTAFVAEMVAIRLTGAGVFDATFGAAGYARLNPDGYTLLRDMTLHADDRIVLAGATGPTTPIQDPLFELAPDQPSPGRWLVARLDANGLPEGTFGAGGIAVSPYAVPSTAQAVAIQSDGRIAVAGAVSQEVRVLRYDVSGATSGAATLAFPGAGTPHVVDLVASDAASVILAATRGDSTYLVKVLENALDPAFIVFARDVATLTATAAGGVLVGAAEEVLRIGANGYPDTSFADQGRLAIAGLTVTRLALLPDAKIVGTGAMRSGPTTQSLALFRIDPAATEFVVTQWLEFPVTSIGTRAFTRQVMVTNTTGAPINVTHSATDEFGATECVFPAIAPGASCLVSVWFRPTHTAAGFTFAEAKTGQLVIQSSSGASATVRLDAIVENGLFRHYYRHILGREADAEGAGFWGAEARRIRATTQELSGSSTVNVAEVWYAMALEFFGSAEYEARFVGDGTYVMDLYRVFFDRDADFEGQSYWQNQLAAGLPREAALANFMLSPEFAQFNATYFGAAPNRPEIDMVFDMYRGLLGRLPDDAGLRYWVGRLQAAQCAGAARVYDEVEAISSLFAGSAEYTDRNRSATDYVVDLYNAFMRRGADKPGVDFWVQRLDSGAVSRDEARRQFASSPEFSGRVQAVVSTACRQ